MVAFEGRIWAVGGCESWSPLNKLEIYDPSTDSWTFGPDLNTPRRGSGLGIINGNFTNLYRFLALFVRNWLFKKAL